MKTNCNCLNHNKKRNAGAYYAALRAQELAALEARWAKPVTPDELIGLAEHAERLAQATPEPATPPHHAPRRTRAERAAAAYGGDGAVYRVSGTNHRSVYPTYQQPPRNR